MTAPNIRTPVTVTGKTDAAALTTTHSQILANSAASNKVLRIITVRVANNTGTEINVTVSRRRSGVDRFFCNGTPVVGNRGLVVTSREDYCYLEEGDSIFASASGSGLDMLVTYEEIS